MQGIAQVVVGYTGGSMPSPTYQNIKDATEAVLIEFDPKIISYEKILEEWSRQHLPYFPQKAQYRSAIFVKNEDERKMAEKQVEAIKTESGKAPVFTDIEEAGPFYRAEEYHQDFLNKQNSSFYI
jgi:methionine-S-sulfoxide reductase